MKMTKILVSLALCAALILGLAGCTVTPVDPDAPPAGIGLSLADPGSAYSTALLEHAHAAAAELSLPLYVAEPAADAADQAEKADALVDRGAKVLILEAMDPEVLASALADTRAGALPLVSLNKTMEGAVCHVAPDHEQAAQRAARYLADALGEGAKVAQLEGSEAVSQAFHAIADTRLTVSARQAVAPDPEAAEVALTAMLAADATIQGVFAPGVESALGALNAIEAKGEDTVLVGLDASYETLKAILAGRMDALLAPQPELTAKAAVGAAADLMKDLVVPSLVPVEMLPVTSRNAEEYLALVEIPEYARPCDVGLSVPGGENPYYAALCQAAVAEADRLGISLTVKDAGGDAAAQAADIEALLVKQIKVLLLVPADGADLTTVLAAAREAGVRIVTLGHRLEESDCHLAYDDASGAPQAVQFFLDTLGPDAKIAMVEMEGDLHCEGFRAVAGDRLNIVAFQDDGVDREETKSRMQQLLEKHVDIQAVFAATDAMAFGALAGLAEWELERPVISVGGSEEALAAIEDGSLTGAIARRPEDMARAAMETALKFLRGREVEPAIPVGLTLILREEEEVPEETAAETTEAAEEAAGETAAADETTEETAAETTAPTE